MKYLAANEALHSKLHKILATRRCCKRIRRPTGLVRILLRYGANSGHLALAATGEPVPKSGLHIPRETSLFVVDLSEYAPILLFLAVALGPFLPCLFFCPWAYRG